MATGGTKERRDDPALAGLLCDALDHLDEAFSLYSPDQRIVLCNRRAGEVWREIADLLVPGTHFRDLCAAFWDRATPGETQHVPDIGATSMELREMSREDWIESRVRFHREGGGTFIRRFADGRWLVQRDRRMPDGHIVSTASDISSVMAAQHISELERKSLAEAMQTAGLNSDAGEREGAVFASMAELASDWFYEMDADLRFTEMVMLHGEKPSPQLGPSIGRTRWEMAGADPETDPVWRAHRDLLESHRPFRDFTYWNRGVLGEPVFLSVSGTPLFDSTGRFTGYRGAVRNLTTVVQAENRAAEAENLLAETIDAISDGFALFDVDDRLIRSNETYRSMQVGVSEISASGVSFADLVRAAEENGWWQDENGAVDRNWYDWRMSWHRKGAQSFERQMSNGRWYRIYEQPLSNGCLAVIMVNISEFKDSERTQQRISQDLEQRVELRTRELLLAKNQAERADRAKSQFLAHVSHELRTPLNAIMGFSEVIKEQLFGPIEQRRYADYAEDIHASGKHLLSLINDLLDLSKIESGQFEINEEQFDVVEIAGAAAKLVEEQANGKSLRLENDITGAVPDLVGDRRAVQQMLANLLSNAIKFTPEGGWIRMSAEADQDGLCLTVEDSGIGIAPGDMDLVMQPFGQVDTEMHGSIRSTGLGLPIVRNLIEMHGGHLQLESEPGRGTRASLHFPAYRLEAFDG